MYESMKWKWRAAAVHKAPASILGRFLLAGAGRVAGRMGGEEIISKTWESGRVQEWRRWHAGCSQKEAMERSREGDS